MKTLIIVVHPDIDNSVINKRWVEALQAHPEKYTIHQLYKAYPDKKIDVLAEQKLIETHDKIIFQFPFYWFNCPPLFKKWLDEVVIYGWAYGSKSDFKMKGKKIALALSVGIDEAEYLPTGKYKYTVTELTTPFEVSFKYVHADYQPLFAFYGIELNPSEAWVEQSVTAYLDYLNRF